VKLPNGTNGIVDIVKLRDYCLNSGHPEGRHKARVFRAMLGMEREDAEELRAALLAAARDQDADATEADEYGRTTSRAPKLPMIAMGHYFARPFGARVF
jgi:hypothetical protein